MRLSIYKSEKIDRIPYPLNIQYISEKQYKLLSRFEYHEDCGKTIGEDEGYIYDIGTVPWWSSWFISRVAFGYEFTIHDIACDRLTHDDGTPMTQKEADDLFLEAVKYVQDSRWMLFKGYIAWIAIRIHSKTIKKLKN